MRVLVTGANGFAGRAVMVRLKALGWNAVGVVRDEAARSRLHDPASGVVVGDLSRPVDWRPVLDGVQAVIHLAARVHVMREREPDPLHAYRAVNVAGTECLAAAAAAAGVRRFVYVSTIKVHGEGRNTAYTPDDPSAPSDPYAISKWEAEQHLGELARETGLEVVAVRPPLVYGPGVGGNFLRLLKLTDLAVRMPLPLAGITNRRSMVFVENLADLLIRCAEHELAPGQVFLVSDGEDLSTPELIMRLARLSGRRARLVRVPLVLLRLGARIAGLRAEVDRLTGSLTVDPAALRERLGWSPPYTVDEGLLATVMWHRDWARR